MTLINESEPAEQASGTNGTLHHLFPRPEVEVEMSSPIPGPRTPVDDAVPAQQPAAPVAEQPEGDRPAAFKRRTWNGTQWAENHPNVRAFARHAVYIGHGARMARSQRRDGNTEARHERMLRAAELAGDHQGAREWMALADEHRKARHERRIAMRAHPAHVARKAVTYTGLTGAGLLALGIVLAVTNKSAHEVFLPLKEAFEVVRWLYEVVEVMWLPAVLATPAAVLLAWWDKGRKRAEVPAWLMSPAQREQHEGEPITPSTLVTALRDLGISELRRKIKAMDDAGAGLLGPITSAGCGIEVDIYLPLGVSTSEIQARREKLAENLGRHKHELFITIPPRARSVRLWIADSGALDEPIGPSPLVTDPKIRADYKTGRAPWGQSLRGDRSTVSLFQRHILVAGISNQGKTASLRALILWLALDRRVRLQIADLKGVGDWSMFKGIAEVLIEGPSDLQVMAATHMVEGTVVEMQQRTDLMRELTEKGWSQEKILADHRFAPLVVIVDEAQKAYGTAAVDLEGCPYGGVRNTSRYFQGVKAIHDQGRAVNVTIGEGVQDPTDQNLPKRSREGNHIRASLVVGTEAQGAMALGENAVNAGAAPHELRQGADKGTVVVAGDITAYDMPRGQVFTTIRTYYVGPEDAVAIADRARVLRKGGVETIDGTPEPAAPVDVLADVVEVLGTERRARSEEVVHRLKSLRPAHYREWTTTELTAALKPFGAEPYKTSGVMHISLARVQEAMADRDQAAETDAESE